MPSSATDDGIVHEKPLNTTRQKSRKANKNEADHEKSSEYSSIIGNQQKQRMRCFCWFPIMDEYNNQLSRYAPTAQPLLPHPLQPLQALLYRHTCQHAHPAGRRMRQSQSLQPQTPAHRPKTSSALTHPAFGSETLQAKMHVY